MASAADPESNWICDANEAVTISLVRPGGGGIEKVASFKPAFTYPIFGENQQIFGYKGLKIHLQYHLVDMRPNLTIASTAKFKPVGDVEPLDVAGVVKSFLPGVAFQKRKDFENAMDSCPETWTPPGTLQKTIERNGEVFEIWKGKLVDPAVKQMLKRTQICVLFFIEGGSYITEDAEGEDLDDTALSRWTVFFLFKKSTVGTKSQYAFQGYSTVYQFWLFQPPTPPASPKESSDWDLPERELEFSGLPRRARISQLLVLPPFQGKGLGAMLYDTIFELCMNDPLVKEITVEDPNEKFDALRDVCDLKYLRSNVPEFASLKLNPDVSLPKQGGILHHSTQISPSKGAVRSAKGLVDREVLEKLRLKVKMAPRQFARLVEIHLMSQLPQSVQPRADPDEEQEDKVAKAPPADRHLYTLWRILLKQRVYKRNSSVLSEFDPPERIEKLDQAIESVGWEYAGILEKLDVSRPGKRKADDSVEGEDGNPAAKKARVGAL